MLPSFICNFLVRMLRYIEKKFKNVFFCPQKVEKTTSKSCILMVVGTFLICSPDNPKQPRTSIPFYNSFYTIVSGKVSGAMNEKF